MALAEFNNPDIQLLVKDDAGTPPGAQQAVQQALDEGAEIILGPLLAQTVAPVGQVARSRGVRVIAFSTDANVAARGVYLLSFLPETDVDRIVDYAITSGKRSFVALMPDNAYGSVVEGQFKQAVARSGASHRGARTLSARQGRRCRPGASRSPRRRPSRADAIFIPDGADAVPLVVQTLDRRAASIPSASSCWAPACGTIRAISADPRCTAPGSPAPIRPAIRSFAGRYRGRYGQDPVRTATLAYDAVALVAALAKTQGTQRFYRRGADSIHPALPASTASSVSGRTDQSARACGLRVTAAGARVINPPPSSFGALGDLATAHAARSATTASSTGKPASVTRSGRSPSVSTIPARRELDAPRIERPPGKQGVACGIDAFGEPQAHEQELVGHLLAGERLVFDHAMAARLDPLEPGSPAASRSRSHSGCHRCRAGRARRARRRHIHARASRPRLCRHSPPGRAWLEIS